MPDAAFQACFSRLHGLQVVHNAATELQKRNFANLRIVFSHEYAFFGIEQALLCLAHFDARQVAQHISFHSDVVVFLRRNQVLSFEAQQSEVVLVSLPQVGQVGLQCQFCLLYTSPSPRD